MKVNTVLEGVGEKEGDRLGVAPLLRDGVGDAALRVVSEQDSTRESHCPPLMHMGRTVRAVQEGPSLGKTMERALLLLLPLIPHREEAVVEPPC
jgi:hypothetical protein